MAIAPAKSLPMQAFMLYMSGSGVQIFSMGIVAMLLFTPFKNIAAMNDGTFRRPLAQRHDERLTAFAQFAPSTAPPRSFSTLGLQKIVYIACNILTLAVGLWKCRSMGLLPLGTGDWLAFEARGEVRCISLYFCRRRLMNVFSRQSYLYFEQLYLTLELHVQVYCYQYGALLSSRSIYRLRYRSVLHDPLAQW